MSKWQASDWLKKQAIRFESRVSDFGIEIWHRWAYLLIGLLLGASLIFLVDEFAWPRGALAKTQRWAMDNNGGNLVTLIGYALAVAGGVLGYFRWSHERRIKRIELLIERLRSFDASPGARNAVMMLNNHDRMIPLWDEDEPPHQRYVRVTWAEVEEALTPHTIREHAFDPKLSAIRDSFEDFLARIAEIWLYIRNDVFTDDDAQRIMRPWIRRFGLEAQRTGVIRRLRIYIMRRRLVDVYDLFLHFGVDISECSIQYWEEVDREVNGRLTTNAKKELGFSSLHVLQWSAETG